MLFEDQVTTRSYYKQILVISISLTPCIHKIEWNIIIPIILHDPFYFELNCILASSNIVSSDIITFTSACTLTVS